LNGQYALLRKKFVLRSAFPLLPVTNNARKKLVKFKKNLRE